MKNPVKDNSTVQKGPYSDIEGTDRVSRGGGWGDRSKYVSVSDRYPYERPYYFFDLGFRLARTIKSD